MVKYLTKGLSFHLLSKDRALPGAEEVAELLLVLRQPVHQYGQPVPPHLSALVVEIKGLVENIGILCDGHDSPQLLLQLALRTFLVDQVDDDLLPVQTFLLLEMSGEAIFLSHVGSELQGWWWFVSEVWGLTKIFIYPFPCSS